MRGREVLRNILDRSDRRLFVVVGPCSIHDPVAGLDYARRLKGSGRRGQRDALPGDAGLFRKAAHHHRLERLHQ
jgi:phospho-2-dehydro-3-deoxyheptonate aldolase